MTNQKKILVYGYGNPGRQDDGLGVLLSEEIEKWATANGITNVETDSNYQLNIEDAEEIKDKYLVIFADASIEDHCEDFILTEVEASEKAEFTMHSVSPAFVLHLCHNIYKKNPKTYLLHIKGYEWELKEGLTKIAQDNLKKAFNFLKEFIINRI